MIKPAYKWKTKETDQATVEGYKNILGVSSLTAKVLTARHSDINEAQKFLHIEQQSFHDPFMMKDMEKGVERIRKAISGGEKIRVYGDYDCDGVTSTAMLYLTLKRMEANVDWYIPNRLEEGYGLNLKAIDRAEDDGVDLIITVDNGIAAKNEIAYAMDKGIDCIVLDHHEPPDDLPECVALINPKQKDCPYPYKGLSGSGVTFKAIQAITNEIPWHLIDLAAIGTVADVMPLTDENRLIVYHGLRQLQKTHFVGLREMIDKLGLGGKTLEPHHISFQIGPRINVCGRMKSADIAFELFTTEDEKRASELIDEIEGLNKERKQTVDQIAKEIIQETDQNQNAIVVAKENLPKGMLGLIASKLSEHFQKPAIVFSIDRNTQTAVGSARSVEGFDIFDNLNRKKEMLLEFGGHTMAAGLSLKTEHIDHIHEYLDHQAEHIVKPEPILSIDAICDLSEINISTIEELSRLAPFGHGNPEPVVLIKNVNLRDWRLVGQNSEHIKLLIHQGEHELDGIGFKMGDRVEGIQNAGSIDVVGTLSINEWNGRKKPQIKIKDIKTNTITIYDWRDMSLSRALASVPENTAVCYFNPKYKLNIKLFSKGQPAICINDRISDRLKSYSHILLYDLPDTIEQLQIFLKAASHAQVLYLILTGSRWPEYKDFSWYYTFLSYYAPIRLDHLHKKIKQYRSWDPDTLNWMNKIFEELDFIIINENIISLVPDPVSKPLTHSPAYKKVFEDHRHQFILQQATTSELIQYIEENMNSIDSIEDLEHNLVATP